MIEDIPAIAKAQGSYDSPVLNQMAKVIRMGKCYRKAGFDLLTPGAFAVALHERMAYEGREKPCPTSY